MATMRNELKPFIDEWKRMEAFVESRADLAGDPFQPRYGFLLTGVEVEGVEGEIDHIWLKIHDLDLAASSSNDISFEGLVSEYYSEGDERHGGDGRGIGVCDIRNVVVDPHCDDLPLKDFAKKVRKERAAAVKAEKAAGKYIWPGAWTKTNDGWKVKAAKSAVPGSRCLVKCHGWQADSMVRLVSQCSPGVWEFRELEMKGGEWVNKEANAAGAHAGLSGEKEPDLATRPMSPV